jgi:hypothetical protein
MESERSAMVVRYPSQRERSDDAVDYVPIDGSDSPSVFD